MRSQPTETQVLSGSNRSLTAPRPEHLVSMPRLPAVDALDAAFADYRRIDTPNSGANTEPDARLLTKALLADISSQLQLLDRQREQLASLLRDVTI
jgi:hypothetical protein